MPRFNVGDTITWTDSQGDTHTETIETANEKGYTFKSGTGVSILVDKNNTVEKSGGGVANADLAINQSAINDRN